MTTDTASTKWATRIYWDCCCWLAPVKSISVENGLNINLWSSPAALTEGGLISQIYFIVSVIACLDAEGQKRDALLNRLASCRNCAAQTKPQKPRLPPQISFLSTKLALDEPPSCLLSVCVSSRCSPVRLETTLRHFLSFLLASCTTWAQPQTEKVGLAVKWLNHWVHRMFSVIRRLLIWIWTVAPSLGMSESLFSSDCTCSSCIIVLLFQITSQCLTRVMIMI